MNDSVTTIARPIGFRKLLLPWCLLVLVCWCSTGTLAPYAATLGHPLVTRDCGYLVNVDAPNFIAPFHLFDGAPPETWQESVVLRRILHPLLAYPFVKAFGFLHGGVLFNVLFVSVGFFWFSRYVSRMAGERAALAAAWLLSTYPGIAYWVGQPFSYICVPIFSLVGFALIRRAYLEPARLVTCSFALGILSVGYDLSMVFVPAIAWIGLREIACQPGRRAERTTMGSTAIRARLCVRTLVALALLVIPQVLCILALKHLFGKPALDGNSGIYVVIARSYFDGVRNTQYLVELSRLPWLAFHNFVFSGFVFIPVLFLASAVRRKNRGMAVVPRGHEFVIPYAFGVFCFWLFLNCAPWYDGWQMRGTHISRLYQPLVAPVLWLLVTYVAEAAIDGSRRLPLALLGVVGLNGAVVFGPLVGSRFSDIIYWHFYEHYSPGQLPSNIELFGARPLGFCRPISSVDPPRKLVDGRAFLP